MGKGTVIPWFLINIICIVAVVIQLACNLRSTFHISNSQSLASGGSSHPPWPTSEWRQKPFNIKIFLSFSRFAPNQLSRRRKCFKRMDTQMLWIISKEQTSLTNPSTAGQDTQATPLNLWAQWTLSIIMCQCSALKTSSEASVWNWRMEQKDFISTTVMFICKEWTIRWIASPWIWPDILKSRKKAWKQWLSISREPATSPVCKSTPKGIILPVTGTFSTTPFTPLEMLFWANRDISTSMGLKSAKMSLYKRTQVNIAWIIQQPNTKALATAITDTCWTSARGQVFHLSGWQRILKMSPHTSSIKALQPNTQVEF